MDLKHLQNTYLEIFKSYGSTILKKHIQKIIELDTYLHFGSTFFCITNTQDLSFKYISKNMPACIGIKQVKMKEKGMRYFWSRIHPEDLQPWLAALNELMKFTMTEVEVKDRKQLNYTWNFRFKNASGNYVNIIQNTSPLEFDVDNKPIIGLAHYTVLDHDIKLHICASAKFLNKKNEYETLYFNNYSQKLLHDGITNRERDVVRLLVLNYSSKEISEKLSITSNTVDTHRRNILKKLNISTTGELVGMLKMNTNLI